MNFSQVLWLSVTLGMFSRQTAWWNLETLRESRSRLQWLVALWQLQITWQPKLLFLCAYFLWFENNALNYRGTSGVAGTICNLSLTLCSILGGRNASQSKLSVSPTWWLNHISALFTLLTPWLQHVMGMHSALLAQSMVVPLTNFQ